MRKLTTTLLLALIAVTSFAQNSFNQPSVRNKTGVVNMNHRAPEVLTGVITALNKYAPGMTMDIYFSLDLSSPDFEYGDSLWMEFPAGFVINSASDPIAIATENQPNETLNTPIVSPFVSWGDNDNNYGGIEPGIHNFFVNVTVPANAAGPLTINWYLSGDEFGAAPNFSTGTTTLNQIPSVPDLLVVGELENKYLTYPRSQAPMLNYSAQVFNNGASLTVATDAYAKIIGSSWADTTAVSIPLNTGDIQTLSWSNPVFIDNPGVHQFEVSVPYGNDFNPADNADSIELRVSDSVYAYTDPVIANNTFGIGDGSDGILGSIFDIVNTQDISTVSCYTPTPDNTANISFVIYEADANGPTNTLVWESDTFSCVGSGPTSYSRSVNVELTGGQRYLIGVREQVTGNMSIGRSEFGYYPDSHYAFFQGSWLEVGGSNFPFAFAIFPHFKGSCTAGFDAAVDQGNPLMVDFTNTSSLVGATGVAYNWDFGDQSGTSNMENPTYTYAANGTYNVCLLISDGGNCSSSSCMDVTVGTNGVAEISNKPVTIYPNPSTGQISIDFALNAKVEVYSVAGSLMGTYNTRAGVTVLDLSDYAKGTYLVKVISEQGSNVVRVSLTE